jgi:hypothetical protein
MDEVEERLAYLEGRFEERSQMMDVIRETVVSLDRRTLQSIEATDRRFDAIDRRFDAVDGHIAALDTKMSRQFMWLVGLQVTTFAAILAAVLAR